MNINEYQKKVMETAIYSHMGGNLHYPTLGLCGEAGELANIVKKIERDNNGVITDKHIEDLSKELGDVLWYAAAISFELKIPLEDICKKNLEKLSSRKRRNVLKGKGDNR